MLLTACSALAKSEPQVGQMLTAIAQRDEKAALALTDYGDVAENRKLFSTQFDRLREELARLGELFFQNVYVDFSGGERTETATMKIKFTDGSTMELDYVTVDGLFTKFDL